MSTLSLLQLTKQFGDVKAVNQVSLEVADGEFLCILGPSGCGKSTALRMIGGFEMPSYGDVLIDGASVVDLPPNRRPTAMVFQKYTLWPHMRIFDNIAFGLRLRRLPKDQIERKVNDALTLVGLTDYGPRFPTQLSGGEQQRVALARALVLEPKILLLDEPFSNLDALLRVRLREELRRIQRQVHITAIFVTHDQEEALSISDRVVVMNKGRVEQVGTPTEIYNTPQTQFVASFVGTLNLLEGRTVNRADNMISIDGQQLCVERIEPTGDVLSVALRPEAITLHRETDVINALPHSNTLHGTVEDVYFLGSVVRIRTRLRDQFVNADTFNNPHANLPTPGEPVLLNFPPEACRVLI